MATQKETHKAQILPYFYQFFNEKSKIIYLMANETGKKHALRRGNTVTVTPTLDFLPTFFQ